MIKDANGLLIGALFSFVLFRLMDYLLPDWQRLDIHHTVHEIKWSFQLWLAAFIVLIVFFALVENDIFVPSWVVGIVLAFVLHGWSKQGAHIPIVSSSTKRTYSANGSITELPIHNGDSGQPHRMFGASDEPVNIQVSELVTAHDMVTVDVSSISIPVNLESGPEEQAPLPAE